MDVTEFPLDKTKRLPAGLEYRKGPDISAIWWSQYGLHVDFKERDYKRIRTVALQSLSGAVLEQEYPGKFMDAVRAKAKSFYGEPMPFELQKVLDRKNELDAMLGVSLASRSA